MICMKITKGKAPSSHMHAPRSHRETHTNHIRERPKLASVELSPKDDVMTRCKHVIGCRIAYRSMINTVCPGQSLRALKSATRKFQATVSECQSSGRAIVNGRSIRGCSTTVFLPHRATLAEPNHCDGSIT